MVRAVLNAIDHAAGQRTTGLAGQHNRLGAERASGDQHARACTPAAAGRGNRLASARDRLALICLKPLSMKPRPSICWRDSRSSRRPDLALRDAVHLFLSGHRTGRQVEDLELGQASLAELGQRGREQLDRPA